MYALPYQPMSVIEPISLVILGMAVAMILLSYMGFIVYVLALLILNENIIYVKGKGRGMDISPMQPERWQNIRQSRQSKETRCLDTHDHLRIGPYYYRHISPQIVQSRILMHLVELSRLHLPRSLSLGQTSLRQTISS